MAPPRRRGHPKPTRITASSLPLLNTPVGPLEPPSPDAVPVIPDWVSSIPDGDEKYADFDAVGMGFMVEECDSEPEPAVQELNLIESHRSMATNVSCILAISYDAAFQLLVAHKWKMGKLLETVTSRPGLAELSSHVQRLTRLSVGTCLVCYGDEELFHLGCEHGFCMECWWGHIHTQVDSRATTIRCPFQGCTAELPSSYIGFIGGAGAGHKYEANLCNMDILTSGHHIHCIRPDCGRVIGIDSIGLCGVATCLCGAQMCWRCRSEPHAPLSCSGRVAWAVIHSDPSNLKWKNEHTTACPNCNVNVEKNDGCNHISCTCGCHFCWACGKPKAKHGDNFPCWGHIKNRGKAVPTAKATEAITEWESAMRAFEESKTSRSEIQGPQELSDRVFATIVAARLALMWTIPFLFFMNEQVPEARIVAELREQLVASVERLEQHTKCVNVTTVYRLVRSVEVNRRMLLQHG